MVGYGVTSSDKKSASTNSGQLAITPDPAKVKAPPKKELTLLEKQQLASQFDSFNSNVSSSSSMQVIKTAPSQKTNTDLLADNLMNANLTNLGSNMSGSKSFSKPMSLQSNSMNISLSQNNQKSNVNYDSNDFFNQFNTPVSSNNFNNKNQMANNSGNMGFFGNLALAAPPKPANNNEFKSSAINPPTIKTSLSQMGNMNNILMPNKPNGQQNKKSAFDDLEDLFG